MSFHDVRALPLSIPAGDASWNIWAKNIFKKKKGIIRRFIFLFLDITQNIKHHPRVMGLRCEQF